MAYSAFTGSITTTGTSKAICLEKALFDSYPEFRLKAKVRANVISHGRILISVVEETPAQESDDDPVIETFLGFLAEDMKSNPKRITPLSKKVISRSRKLTRGVVVDEKDVLPADVGF